MTNEPIRIRKLLTRVNGQRNRLMRDGFLHIPKTAGTTMQELLEGIANRGQYVPVYLPHGWKLVEAVQHFPGMRISFVLRDPVERAVSGFLSRQRIGRPHHNVAWSADEAKAFGDFADPIELLRALIGDDERRKSAALFAMKSIQHLRLNYTYYFHSVETIAKHEHSIGVIGSMDNVDGFINQFARLSGCDAALAGTHYTPLHVGSQNASETIAQLSKQEHERIKATFADEYRIYDYLRNLRDSAGGFPTNSEIPV